MDFRIEGNPDFGELVVALGPGETILAESGAMSRMSPGMELRGRLGGGLLAALGRKVFGGESFFLGAFTSPGVGFLALAPDRPGQVRHRRLQGETLMVSAGSFLACTPGIRIRTRWLGLKGIFFGKGGFALQCSGEGDLFFHAFGALREKEVEGRLLVDTDHAAAWDPGLEWKVRGMGNLKSTFLSGEGLVLEFSGKGRVWIQTRTLGETARWLAPWCGG